MPDQELKPLWRRFLVFLLPLMLSNILQSLSGTINNIYIGQLIGVEALAAASVFVPILLLLIGFIVGLASGASILIGQAWGAKNLQKVKEVAGTTLTSAFVGGVGIAVLGLLFVHELLGLLGAPANIVEDAAAYGRIFFAGIPLFFVFLSWTSMLRGVGDTVTPLFTLSFSIIAGLVVTPAFMLGWWGLPQLGVEAAAVAFVAGTVMSLAFSYVYLTWRKSPLALDASSVRYLRVDLGLLGVILRLGVPAGIAMMVSSLSAIVIIGLVNRFGSDATAAFGAVNQVLSYVQFPAMSMMIASSIFAAQAIGARRMDEVEHVTRTGLIMNLVITGGFVLLAYLFSEHLVRLFITSEEVVQMTETLLHIVLWSVVMSGFAGVFSAVMRASGDVWVPMTLTLISIVAVELPAAIILSEIVGLNGIWIGYSLSFTAALLLQAGYYLLFWRKKEIRALV